MRISKNPEERKRELIAIARQLFIENGYDNVKVSDIVREAHVAQGTFYYYFKTKEAVLSAIIEEMISGMGRQLDGLVKHADLSARVKLETMMSMLFTPLNKEEPIFMLMSNTSEVMHQRLDHHRGRVIRPILEVLIREGIKNKEFNELDNVEVITRIMFDGVSKQMHVMSFEPDSRELEQVIDGTEEICKRLLGTDFDFAMKNTTDRSIERMKQQ